MKNALKGAFRWLTDPGVTAALVRLAIAVLTALLAAQADPSLAGPVAALVGAPLEALASKR